LNQTEEGEEEGDWESSFSYSDCLAASGLSLAMVAWFEVVRKTTAAMGDRRSLRTLRGRAHQRKIDVHQN